MVPKTTQTVPIVTPKRVMVVEDDFYARQFLVSTLYRDPRTTVCHQADTVSGQGAAIAEMEAYERPEAALVDIEDHSPAERLSLAGIIAELQAAQPGMPVIYLSMTGDPARVAEALQAGASGFLLKNELQHGLVDAIELAMRGQQVITAGVVPLLPRPIHRPLFVLNRWELNRFIPKRCVRAFQLTVVFGMDAASAGKELHLSKETIETYRKQAYEEIFGRSPDFDELTWSQQTALLRAWMLFCHLGGYWLNPPSEPE